jgi:hypothetical protein
MIGCLAAPGENVLLPSMSGVVPASQIVVSV